MHCSDTTPYFLLRNTHLSFHPFKLFKVKCIRGNVVNKDGSVYELRVGANHSKSHLNLFKSY